MVGVDVRQMAAVALVALVGSTPAPFFLGAGASGTDGPWAVQTATGTGHSCALLEDGTARCWGQNYYGRLGDGTTTARSRPTPVAGLAGAVAIDVGSLHSCALLADATVSCWGHNGYGQLGTGTGDTNPTPLQVPGLTGVAAISAGGGHTCALLLDATATCWGSNFYGEVGDGTSNNGRPAPVPVVGLTGILAIRTGDAHTCALLDDGSVRCWGANSWGAVGDGTRTHRATPTAVAGVAGAVDVGAGFAHSCAVLANGTAMCWGENFHGQIGSGAPDNEVPTPEYVQGLQGAVAITPGYDHTCALLAAGGVSCWGGNVRGELGDGTTTARSTPGPVSGLADATQLAGGWTHQCALRASGAAVCWGSGQSAQIGDGAWQQRNVPTAVSGIPNRAPDAPLLPSGATLAQTGASQSYSTWATDPDADLVQVTFDWGDGSTTTTASVAGTGAVASAAHAWASPGTYCVRAYSTDAAGAAGAWSPCRTVTAKVDGVPPVVALREPTEGHAYVLGIGSPAVPAQGALVAGPMTVNAVASDNVGVVRVEFWLDGRVRLATDSEAPYGFAWDPGGHAPGQHRLDARAFDADGNVGFDSVVVVTAGTPI